MFIAIVFLSSLTVPIDRFLQSLQLHHMVGIELQMINPAFFFGYLKGHCHGNQFSGKNI